MSFVISIYIYLCIHICLTLYNNALKVHSVKHFDDFSEFYILTLFVCFICLKAHQFLVSCLIPQFNSFIKF